MNSPFLSRRFLMTQWAISALYSLAASLLILFYKVSPEQDFYSGISSERLIAISLPTAFFILAAYSMLQALAGSGGLSPICKYIFDKPVRITGARFFAGIIAGISVIGLCLPGYYFGDYAEHYIRIKPLILWAGVLSLHLSIILVYPRRNDLYKKIKTILVENRSVLRLSVWILLSFLLLWVFIAKTGLGISGHEDFWYEAGVPILPAQVLVSILAGILFSKVESFLAAAYPTKLDTGLFFGIWLIAALIWGFTPAPNSYFNPAPLPPSKEVYPYSDAAGYDLQSQYALIGQGLNNGKSVDNPLYPAFLVLIHLFTGQNYSTNMTLQAMIFAVFPAIIYLIGTILHERTLGVITASMIVLRGYNSIAAASMVNLASPKQMLTDFPTAIGIALSIYTLLKLLDRKSLNPKDAIWHGGAIGMAFLIRPTALVVLAIFPIIAIIKRFPFGKWLRIAVLILAGFVIFITPWGIRNTLHGHNAISTYLGKLNLVIKERFPETKEKQPNSPSEITGDQLQVDPENSWGSQPVQFLAVTKTILNHFFHSIIGTALILPTSAMFDDLRHILKSPHTIWRPFWNGYLGLKQSAVFLTSLILLTIGIAISWKRKQITVLGPGLIFFIYQLANSVGRTSGGRYIAPVDWIIILYFGVGLIELCKALTLIPGKEEIRKLKSAIPTTKHHVTAIFIVLFVGAIPLFTEIMLSNRYLPEEKDISDTISNYVDILSQSPFTDKDIEKFLQKNRAVLLSGHAFYPRYLGSHAIVNNVEGGLEYIKFPHFEFYLLGPRQVESIVLYKTTPVRLPNNTILIVLGCKQKTPNYIDAVAVLVLEPQKRVHLRESGPILECPMPQPICDTNGACHLPPT